MSGSCDCFDFEENQDEFQFMDGLRGANGKSAYEAAVEGGFTGTEAEFNAYLSGIGDLTDLVDRKAGMLVDRVSGAIASFVPDATVPNLLGVSVESGATSLYRTGKNLLKNTATTKTIQGVTYTVNSDGTIDVSGSATSYALLTINNTIRLPKSRITLSGLGEATNIVWNQFFLYDASGTQIGTLIGTGKNQDAGDYTFDLTQYPAVAYGMINVKRGANGAVGGTIKPMIRIAPDADETFLAYNGDTFPVANQTVQDIATITGQINNVWADAGDVDVEYAADIKWYIDKLNQPIEEDMIANTLIESGKYFTVNNKLYLSTASIAVGAQIIPGTNCTETSLVEALNALNA